MKRDPDFERRRRYFSASGDEGAQDYLHDVMKQIGFYQMEENNLSHIKGYQAAKENGERVKKIKQERGGLSLQMPM